jgi:excisionase family DNA binding protein
VLKIAGIYSTGELAQALCVGRTSVIRMIDSGEIASYRVPGSRYRRVTRKALERYVADHPEFEFALRSLSR